MTTVAKIAVSLDPELLRKAERLRRATGESRSALVSRALGRIVDEHDLQVRIAEYVKAYEREPEQPRDVELARAMARRSLETLAWDDE
jgi:metal-responsive CopG/Arc/MetJ family transcriptional regulator